MSPSAAEGVGGAISYYDALDDKSATPVLSRALSKRGELTQDSSQLVLVLVGMPARGKSFISAKLYSYLSWSGYRVRVFNVGAHRRRKGSSSSKDKAQALAPKKKKPPPPHPGNNTNDNGTPSQQTPGIDETTPPEDDVQKPGVLELTRSANSDASFFDSSNAAAKAQREAIAMEVLDSALDWLAGKHHRTVVPLGGGGTSASSPSSHAIAIFDATNSTRARRRHVVEKCSQRGAAVVFVESICDDADVVEANMRTKVRASPDFAGMGFDAALADLRARIENYAKAYETVEDDEGAYVKLFDFSSKVTAHMCFGRMSKTVVPFLMAVHSNDRPIYLTALAPKRREPEWIHNSRRRRKTSGRSPVSVVETETVVAAAATQNKNPATTTTTTLQYEEDPVDYETRLAHWWWHRDRTPCALQRSVRIAEDRADDDPDSSSDVPMSTGPRLRVFSSTMPLAIDAALVVQSRGLPDQVCVSHTSALNPLLLGDADEPPSTFVDRPDGGESYQDLVNRLESCLLDVEAAVDPVLLVTHATAARALRAYFHNIDLAEIVGDTTSPETRALADAAPAVLELRPKIGGGFLERIHWI